MVYLARRRNLVGLTIGRDFLVSEWLVHIAVEGTDTKNGRPISAVLAPDVAEWMRRYLEVHRPLLLRDSNSDRLWFGRRGRPLDYYAFQRIMTNLGVAVLGRPITTHVLRHAVATFTMTRDPRNGALAMDLLSHRTARTVDRYYDTSGRKPAQGAWERILRDMRRKAREEDE